MPDHQQDRDRHGRVRDVEDVEAPRPDPDVGEVDDVAETDPVDEVADRAAEQQAQGHGHDPAAPARPELEAGEDGGNGDGDRPRSWSAEPWNRPKRPPRLWM